MNVQSQPPRAFSEVAWLREQIELQYQGAANGLYGYGEVASHEAITRKMERVAIYGGRLQELVGREEGIKMTIEAMNRASEENAASKAIPRGEAS